MRYERGKELSSGVRHHVLILVPLTKHLLHIFHFQSLLSFDKELKKLALITILFSLAFGTGINI